MKTTKAKWHSEIPGVLVGVSIPNETRRGRRSPDLTFSNTGNGRHAYYQPDLQDTGVDFFSIHVYLHDKAVGSATHSFEECLNSSDYQRIDRTKQPVVIGETGIRIPNYLALDDATKAL